MGGGVSIKPAEGTRGPVYHVKDNAQRSGFSASVGTQEAIYITLFYGKGKVFYSGKVSKLLGEVVDG